MGTQVFMKRAEGIPLALTPGGLVGTWSRAAQGLGSHLLGLSVGSPYWALLTTDRPPFDQLSF